MALTSPHLFSTSSLSYPLFFFFPRPLCSSLRTLYFLFFSTSLLSFPSLSLSLDNWHVDIYRDRSPRYSIMIYQILSIRELDPHRVPFSSFQEHKINACNYSCNCSYLRHDTKYIFIYSNCNCVQNVFSKL